AGPAITDIKYPRIRGRLDLAAPQARDSLAKACGAVDVRLTHSSTGARLPAPDGATRECASVRLGRNHHPRLGTHLRLWIVGVETLAEVPVALRRRRHIHRCRLDDDSRRRCVDISGRRVVPPRRGP